MVRCFLAAKIGEPIVAQVSALIPQLGGASLKLVNPENYHFTLKFLGERSQEEISTLSTLLPQALKAHTLFQATAAGVGAFPSPDHIKVIWVGMSEGKEQYIQLQKAIENSLANLNIKKEREYIPHLTIARVKEVFDKGKLQQFLQANSSTNFGRFQVDSISLMKSELTPEGPLYSDLKTFLFPKTH